VETTGLSKPRTHTSTTTGARDASSWGSIVLLVFKHGSCGSSDSVPSADAHASSRKGGGTSTSHRRKAGSKMRASLAARATGNGVEGERVLAPAGQHVRGSESSEGVSTFRIVLQKSFDEAVAQRSCAPAKACAR